MSGYYEGRKTLVCGGAGFVGTNTALALLERGAEVVATWHESSPQIDDKRIEWRRCDLTTAEGCARAVEGVDLVINAAASSSGASVIQSTPLAHVTPNVLLNTLLLDACYQAGVEKALFISSNTVYPDLDHAVTEEEMMSGEPYGKYFPVAWMKRFGEILGQIYSEKIPRAMPVVVVRPGNLYGPYDDFDWETSHALPALMRKSVERKDPFEVWGDGKDVKDFLFIDDFVSGMLLAMERLEGYEPVNIASGQPAVLNDVLNVILEQDGFAYANIKYLSDKPTMIPKRLIDISKARRLLGYEPVTPIEEGVRRTLAWYRKKAGER